MVAVLVLMVVQVEEMVVTLQFLQPEVLEIHLL
jgi:hypothetical protein